MAQLVCASATDFISIEPECTYISFFVSCKDPSSRAKCSIHSLSSTYIRDYESERIGHLACEDGKDLTCLQQKKYGFMLITRKVYKCIMYLISNYCEFN